MFPSLKYKCHTTRGCVSWCLVEISISRDYQTQSVQSYLTGKVFSCCSVLAKSPLPDSEVEFTVSQRYSVVAITNSCKF